MASGKRCNQKAGHMSDFSEEELSEIRAIQAKHHKWVELNEPAPIVGDDRKVLISALQSQLSESKKSPTLVSIRRKRMDSLLYAWGEYRQPQATSSMHGGLSTGGIAANAELLESGLLLGYDHTKLSDYASLMISIDMVISDLNIIDRVLINYVYKDMLKNPRISWCNRFNKTEAAFKMRKARLQDKLIENIFEKST